MKTLKSILKVIIIIQLVLILFLIILMVFKLYFGVILIPIILAFIVYDNFSSTGVEIWLSYNVAEFFTFIYDN